VLSEPEKAWLAAVIDGEGSVYLQRLYKNPKYNGGKHIRASRMSVKVTVGNTHRPFLERMREITQREFGIGSISVNRSTWKPNRKPVYQFAISGEKARRLLGELLPILIIKRAKAEELVQYRLLKDAERFRGGKP